MNSDVPVSAPPVGRARSGRGFPAMAVAVLGLAMASVVWSESWFWGRWRADQTLGSVCGSVVFYAAVTHVCLVVTHRYRVPPDGPMAWRRVFLLGALYGWLAEGVLVTTAVAGLPLSISYTGLAWHALFTVLLGWWWVPRILGARRPVAVAWLALLGVGIGGWAVSRQLEDSVNEPVGVFLGYVTVSTLAYAIGIALWWRFRARREPRWRDAIWALVVLGAFAVLHLVTAPITIIGPLLVVLAWWSLRRTAPGAVSASLATAGPAPVRRLWLLGVVPVTASGTYASITALSGPIPTEYLYYAVTVPLGFVLFGLAWRRPRPAPPTRSTGVAQPDAPSEA